MWTKKRTLSWNFQSPKVWLPDFCWGFWKEIPIRFWCWLAFDMKEVHLEKNFLELKLVSYSENWLKNACFLNTMYLDGISICISILKTRKFSHEKHLKIKPEFLWQKFFPLPSLKCVTKRCWSTQFCSISGQTASAF